MYSRYRQVIYQICVQIYKILPLSARTSKKSCFLIHVLPIFACEFETECVCRGTTKPRTEANMACHPELCLDAFSPKAHHDLPLPIKKVAYFSHNIVTNQHQHPSTITNARRRTNNNRRQKTAIPKFKSIA